MPIHRHSLVSATAALAALALNCCSAPDIEAESRNDAAPVATLATATSSPMARSGSSRIVNGFIVDLGPPQPVDPRGRYYVEFRSRWLAVYGHTYVVYGRLDDAGHKIDQHFAALYPRDGYLGLTAGSLPLSVPATTLPVAEDSEYSELVVYWRPITATQYEQIEQFVYEARSRQNYWNLYTTNCNYFAGEIAGRIGLKVPPSSAQVAPLYVKELEVLNG